MRRLTTLRDQKWRDRRQCNRTGLEGKLIMRTLLKRILQLVWKAVLADLLRRLVQAILRKFRKR
jgi:hypothetical protein